MADNINVLVSEGERQIVINAEITLKLEERNEVENIHVSDLIYAGILDKIKSQELATMPKGKYRVSFTAAVTTLEDDLEE